jgi:AraC-like DNA-binding protein
LRNYSVDEVCDLVGYNNLSHFSRSFKQHTGHSPKQYQSMEHNEKQGDGRRGSSG